jgi:hypothetical protein
MKSDSNIQVRLFETGPAPSCERAEPVTFCPRRPSSPSLGSAYSPAALDAALENRSLLELQAMIRPAEDLARYRADMAAWDSPERANPVARSSCLSSTTSLRCTSP